MLDSSIQLSPRDLLLRAGAGLAAALVLAVLALALPAGPAAQWALAMASQGPTLFGSEWSATRGQLRRWSAISARSVREHAAGIADHDRGE